MVFALLLTISVMGANILETYRKLVDAFVGTRSQVTVTSAEGEDVWTYDSEFTSAKEAYDGFKEFYICAAQERYLLLKTKTKRCRFL